MFYQFPASLQPIQTASSSSSPSGMRTSQACGSRRWQSSSSWSLLLPWDCPSWLSFTGLLHAARYVRGTWTSLVSQKHVSLNRSGAGMHRKFTSQMNILGRSWLGLNNLIIFNVAKITQISQEIEKEMQRRKHSPAMSSLLICQRKASVTMAIYSHIYAYLFIVLNEVAQHALTRHFK